MKKTVCIIGGGPSALVLAAFLDPKKFSVTIYEKNKAVGRKFLVAGKGGFNLTHGESMQALIQRYTPSGFLDEALQNFSNEDFRNWLAQIGIPTYVGSSNRVYPTKGIKPIEVLKGILAHLNQKGVEFKYEHEFTGWDSKNNPIIQQKSVTCDYTVFSLGGASWKITGSNGSWLNTFAENKIKTRPFQASNCGYQIAWTSDFIEKHEGTPLKNMAISCGNSLQKGEAVITKFGLEGNAIYGLSPQIRQELQQNGKAIIFADFKPSLTKEIIAAKLQSSKQKNNTAKLKKDLKVVNAQIDLLKSQLSKETYMNLKALAGKLKRLPLEIVKAATLDEAISSVGGIDISSVSSNFEIQQKPNQFCIGEMLDWDAPTGGYLLQACASIGVHVAQHLNSRY